MDGLIFRPYAPSIDIRRTAASAQVTRRVVADLGLSFVQYACTTPTDYAYALQQLWSQPGPLIVWEHDIVASVRDIRVLLTCPEPVCAADYELENGVLWSTLVDARVLGLCKIEESARRAVVERPEVPRTTWQDVAYQVIGRVGRSQHLHPKVRHDHRAA